MQFIFEQIRSGGDRNFGYLIGDRQAGVGVVVDPSYIPEEFVNRAQVQGLKLNYIMNTHGHVDHTNGNERVKELTHAKILTYRESLVSHDLGVKDNEIIKIGSLDFVFLHCPGHASDHLVIFLPFYKIAITGDHLFVGKIGGTQTEMDAEKQFLSFQRMFKEIPDDVTIWPGHDYGCRPSSTMALEKLSNPFLQAKSFEEFLKTKILWSSVKQQYGLK